MEHRFCKRRDVIIPSDVRFHDGLVAHGKITNISFDGACVQYHGVERLAVDSVIRIEFSLPAEGKADGISICMPALVVHRGSHGAGVMFLHEDAEFARQLKKALESDAQPLSSAGVRERVSIAQNQGVPIHA